MLTLSNALAGSIGSGFQYVTAVLTCGSVDYIRGTAASAFFTPFQMFRWSGRLNEAVFLAAELCALREALPHLLQRSPQQWLSATLSRCALLSYVAADPLMQTYPVTSLSLALCSSPKVPMCACSGFPQALAPWETNTPTDLPWKP